MKIRLVHKPIGFPLLCLALLSLGGSVASAQDFWHTPNLPDSIEVDPFGGASFWGTVQKGLDTKLIDGGVVGIRLNANVTNYIGLEFMYQYGFNNVRLVTPVALGVPTYNFGARNQYVALNPVFHFTPKGSKIRPYLTVGVGWLDYQPTTQAKAFAQGPYAGYPYYSSSLGNNVQVGINYGGGVKIHASERIGFRLDARGMFSRNPTFGLPNYPTGGVYIPNKTWINGLELTAGVTFYLGKIYVPAPLPPPVIHKVSPLGSGSIDGFEGLLCQGKPITLHAHIVDPEGHPLGYAWKLNGAPSGANSPDLTFTPNNGGEDTVEVTVTDTTDASRTVSAGPVSFSVKEYLQPQITSLTSSSSSLVCSSNEGAHSATLTANATGSACGGNLTYKWSVSEGSISGSGSSATFDSSSLTFDPNATATKTATATVTVTDDTGKSASKTVDIVVNCSPNIRRFNDVDFAKDKARVNNCGKRILIDEVAPALASGDWDVAIIGHIDTDENANLPATGKGKKKVAAEPLDQARALNAAAVLSGGTGTCGKVDPSRIKVAYVGTSTTPNPDPGLCGTSARPEQKERKGSVVTDSDKNRRVDVYLIPKGTSKIGDVDLKPLPEDQVKALGCPK
jgi:outer membrane protein OmpA-like peptidoglycan-associated protein